MLAGGATICETNFASREFDSFVLTIIIDSMDKKKAVWPKYDFNQKPQLIEGLKLRPRMTVTGGIAHGWCTGIFITQATLSHGSNAYVECRSKCINLHVLSCCANCWTRLLSSAGS